MLSSFWRYGKSVSFAALVFTYATFVSHANQSVSGNIIRVADFVNYTHICIELSGQPGKVEFQSHALGNYSILTVKLHGIGQGNLSSEEPVQSDILLKKIAVSSSSNILTLTIPCRNTVDFSKMASHKWDDMVTIDLPLLTPNHAQIPPIQGNNTVQAAAYADTQVVIIDAGHGGFDPGAVPKIAKKPWLKEKDVALDLAHRLKDLFERNPKTKVYLTRYGDYLPVPFGLKGRTRSEYKDESLRYRVKLAKEYLGNVYLSLHLNAPPSQSSHARSRGFEIYYLGNQHAENLIKNPDVVELTKFGIEEQKVEDAHSGLLLGLLKDTITQSSLELAGSITTEVSRIPWLELREPAMKSQRFVVIKQLMMPSVLIECMFITNPTEHEQIRNDANKNQLAKAIYSAVCKFLFEPSVPIQIASQPQTSKTIETAPKTEPSQKPAPLASPPPQTKTSTEPIRHTVRSNETLESIAKKYGVSVIRLRQMNRGKIGRSDLIQPGDVLTITSDSSRSSGSLKTPTVNVASAQPSIHTVRPGDSLYKIALRYKTTVDKLRKLNNYKAKNPSLNPGDKIRVR